MPVIISKEVFYEKVDKNIGCELLHSWEPDCKIALISAIPKVATGTAKFFLPVLLLRMAIDYKRKKKNLVKTFIERQIRAVLYGLSMGFIFLVSICILNRICGRIYYYNILFIPAMLSGASILVELEDNQILNTLIFFNSSVETILNKLQLSVTQQTLLFMTVSGILMQLFENRKEEIDFNYLWFFTPPLRNPKNDVQNRCSHYEKCTNFCFDGFKNFFVIGAGINITKRLLGTMKLIPRYPMKIFDIIFHKSNVYFGLLVGTYVGLYRALTCYLTKSKTFSEKWHGLISGFLSGITYSFYPTIQVPVLAITTTLQIFYHILCKKYNITNHFYQRLLLFQVAHGYNMHNTFLSGNICSPYYAKMIDTCSGNIVSKVFEELIAKYFL